MNMHRLVTSLAFLLALSACAPRQVVRPIPADTPPAKVLGMLRARESGLDGIRAMVKVRVTAGGAPPNSFDAVLYAAKPDRVRLTGLAFSSYTIFDIVIRGGKFYFYQPSEGYLYAGPAGSLPGFLEGRGVKADPAVMLRAMFLASPGEGESYMLDTAEGGYDLYLARNEDGVLVPSVRTEYDVGLNEKRRVFFDSLARPYLTVETPGFMDVDGYSLPDSLVIRDARGAYKVDVFFEKYLVNPEGLEGDFSIQGGEFKGIREVE